MTVKVPKLISDITPQIQEAHSNSLPKKMYTFTYHVQIAKICEGIQRGREHLTYQEKIKELHLTSVQEPWKKEESEVKYLKY